MTSNGKKKSTEDSTTSSPPGGGSPLGARASQSSDKLIECPDKAWVLDASAGSLQRRLGKKCQIITQFCGAL
jgi:hypothetical protein